MSGFGIIESCVLMLLFSIVFVIGIDVGAKAARKEMQTQESKK